MKTDLIFSEDGDLKYFYEFKPNRNINNKPSWLPDDYKYEITINAEGLNERYEYSVEKAQNTFRILTLGDSFTYGLYVNTKDNYPEKLEDLLNSRLQCKNIKKFEVINLGVGGYDIEYAITRFKKRGLKYNPDVILWLLKNDDFRHILDQDLEKSKIYRKQMEQNGQLEEYQNRDNFYPYNAKTASDLEEQYGEDKILQYQYSAMESLRRMYKNILVILGTPSGSPQAFNEHQKKLVEKFVGEHTNVYFYGQLPKLIKPDTAFPDWHPNEAGYRLFANEIFDYLTSTNLIPCN